MTHENHHVFFEGPAGKPMAEIMGEMRSWLDGNKITLCGFSYETARSGAIEIHLTFGSRHHAALFEHTFCSQPALHTADQIKRRA
jgi:hypothetical protein